MSTINSTPLALSAAQTSVPVRVVAELAIGFAAIMVVLWLPTREQLVFGPVALLAPLILVLLQRPTLTELGLDLRGFVRSLWILPVSIAIAAVGVLLARTAGTLHDLYKGDFAHIAGYVLWTIYQQFLLQIYFMPRVRRVLRTDAAIAFVAVLFALAHLPNVILSVATLVWGAASCLLFRRYRSLVVLGIAQGLLGLTFAICVPDVFLHHMRVGLGYWQYPPPVTGQHAAYQGTAGK